MDTVLKRSELFKNDFRNLETNLGTTRKWDIFGPLSKNDFPEITNGIQASILSYGIVTANMYPPLYFNSLGDPERKRLFENLIMSEKNPSLAVTVKPQFHFVRLTGRDARLFPKDLIEPVRKIWRDAMVQATLITEQRRYWESALNLAAEKEGVKFPLKEEHAFPALAAFDDKLMQNRRAYLGNLQRLFREHGLLR